jgi:hypothetical protein
VAEPRSTVHKRPRISVITDWRIRDEDDLPDVAPGTEYECVIAPQKFVALRRIVVRDLTLVRLAIGTIKVPFELESADGPVRTYRLRDLGDEDLRRRLVKTGAAVATSEMIAIVPGLEVRTVLRNETTAPAKPRAALIVHEEVA